MFRHKAGDFDWVTFVVGTRTLLAARPDHSQQDEYLIGSWDVESSMPREHERRCPRRAGAVVSPDGAWLASSDGNALRLDDTLGRQAPIHLESDARLPRTSLTFSPDGQTLASVDQAGRVQLWPWRKLVEA